ncbi:MipA/OmpV family protein [Limnohabitans sp. Jir61]|uniref:MipA/OmpV family protein n=1 Tax=Limnohabitans sp. Jir61 TaxID=1826168 RepID=UPI001304E9A8|nr:MipA/OmpV family protein [Limnohabitans sp. Jir61]
MLLACVFALPIMGRADDAVLPDKLEVTAGLSRTSQSLVHGVLITFENEPTLNVNYETAQGFASVQNGVGVWLVRDELFKAGLSVNYMMGRQEKADVRYSGMGNVAGSAMSYVWAEWQPIKDAITLYGNAGNSWHSGSGTLVQWGATIGFPLINQVNGFVDVSRYWANQRYVQTYYGVTQSQSQASHYGAFNAHMSGTLYANAQMGVAIELDRDIDLIASFGRSTASSMLMESPLLNQKSQTLSALVLSRRFP